MATSLWTPPPPSPRRAGPLPGSRGIRVYHALTFTYMSANDYKHVILTSARLSVTLNLMFSRPPSTIRGTGCCRLCPPPDPNGACDIPLKCLLLATPASRPAQDLGFRRTAHALTSSPWNTTACRIFAFTSSRSSSQLRGDQAVS